MKTHHFHSKLLRQKPILRQIEWQLQNWPITKSGVFPVTALFFWRICFSFRTSWKELIWCTNDPNVHIRIFHKRWSLILGCFFPVIILNLVLITTWYTSNSQFYQQTDDVAVGVPASWITAEIYLQAHEHTAISTTLHPRKVWERWWHLRTHLENFLHHINKLFKIIEFTMEEERNGELTFLETLLKQNNGKISVLVYRNPMHTDQYLYYSFHHQTSYKESVVSSLFNRAYSIITNKDDLSSGFWIHFGHFSRASKLDLNLHFYCTFFNYLSQLKMALYRNKDLGQALRPDLSVLNESKTHYLHDY